MTGTTAAGLFTFFILTQGKVALFRFSFVFFVVFLKEKQSEGYSKRFVILQKIFLGFRLKGKYESPLRNRKTVITKFTLNHSKRLFGRWFPEFKQLLFMQFGEFYIKTAKTEILRDREEKILIRKKKKNTSRNVDLNLILKVWVMVPTGGSVWG